MTHTYLKTFRIILALIFLLPIFFIPGGLLSLAAAKSIVLMLGVVIASIVFIWETWKAGKIDLPWHPTVLVVVLLPVIYFLSALLSTPVSLSLFGYNFEVGTFGFILLVSALLLIVSIVMTDEYRVLKSIMALFISLSIVVLLAVIKVTSGYPVWGIFFTKTSNLIGNWTDLAAIMGLLSVLSALAIGMLPMAKSLRIVSYVVFTLSLVLTAILNFSSVFVFTLIASVLLFIYFSKMDMALSDHAGGVKSKRNLILPIILGVVSLVMIINPSISASRGRLGDVLSGSFGVNNTDIRPSFSATLSISKAVLSRGTVFGSGPNTFSRDWLVHKPAEVNATPFWGSSFTFGSGFIPTQIASTGLVGTLLWFSLLVFILWIGIKAMANLPELRGPRFALVATFIGMLYLWTAGFMYAPSIVVLALTFVVTGLFISSARGLLPTRSIVFTRDSATGLASSFLLFAALIGSVALGYVGVKKTVSVFYFQKASTLAAQEDISLVAVEQAINKAIVFAPADVYYTALSRLYFAGAQQAASATTGTDEEKQQAFQTAISSSISTARAAVSLNPSGYENWLTLGSVYAALVPKPLEVVGAYENAQFAYSQAANTNPSSPETPLLMAQLEMNKGDLAVARNYARQAILLKEDYADAYVLLARIEVQDKNLPGAIASTEVLSTLNPDNPGIHFELGLLKSSNQDLEGAVLSFSKALELLPGYANAKYYLGLTLEQLGRKDEALVHFEELLATNPDNAEIKEAIERLSK